MPVYFINSDALKDAVDADLRRSMPGPGYQHFPQVSQEPGVRSISEAFFAELVAEQRGPKGWRKVAARNEAFDLKAYNRAAFILLKAERIDWKSPPAWAAEWDRNSYVASAGLALDTPAGTAAREALDRGAEAQARPEGGSREPPSLSTEEAAELAAIEREIAELEAFIAKHGDAAHGK